MSKLKPYFVTDSPGEWAMLVFHYTNRKARNMAIDEWPFFTDSGLILRIRCWKADDKYMKFAEANRPHVVDSYDGNFETWGEALKNLEAANA